MCWQILSKYSTDTFRYYACASTTYGADVSFNEASLLTMHNSELADVLGNLVRVLAFGHVDLPLLLVI